MNVVNSVLLLDPSTKQAHMRILLQMPKGVPVATVAIGNAANAGLLALRILAGSDTALQQKMLDYQVRLAVTGPVAVPVTQSSSFTELYTIAIIPCALQAAWQSLWMHTCCHQLQFCDAGWYEGHSVREGQESGGRPSMMCSP